jgi:hypothetical protein
MCCYRGAGGGDGLGAQRRPFVGLRQDSVRRARATARLPSTALPPPMAAALPRRAGAVRPHRGHISGEPTCRPSKKII